MGSSKQKTFVSAIILLIGLVTTVFALQGPSSAFTSSGIIIDFGGYDIDYSEQDSDLKPDEALRNACDALGYKISWDGSTVTSINGVSNSSIQTWNLYTISSDGSAWERTDGSSPLSAYKAVCYGYCSEGGLPSSAVDATGQPIYGYDKPSRIVSLAPSCTETLCAVGGTDMIIGTDRYSNYPEVIAERQESGEIAIVGGFTNPSYEMVLKQNPDLVVCISTQSAHITLAEKLRGNGVNVLVLDGGESIDAVLDNIHLAGAVLDNAGMSKDKISELRNQMDSVHNLLRESGETQEKRVLVALSATKSPYASGSNTYVSDAMSYAYLTNVFSEADGWAQIGAESIAQYDPEVIIIVSSDYDISQSDYDAMLSSMAAEWKITTAFKAGEIYLFGGDAADCASRPGPRVAELTELIAMATHGDAFEKTLPKYIGDEYKDYLALSKEVTA